MDAQSLIDALRARAKKFVALDTPGDQDLADVATDIGAGFVPFVGTAGVFRSARRVGFCEDGGGGCDAAYRGH